MNIELGSTANIRELNQEVILAALRKCEEASVAELARMADLSIATCAKIVGELAESGEVVEFEGKSKGGRPARRYSFNPNHSLLGALILQVTGKKEFIQYFIADANGTILQSGTADTGVLNPAAVDTLLDALKKDYPALKAVSVSIPGTMTEGVIGPAEAPGLTGMHVEEFIKTRHGLSASVDNDMNFAALGYYKCHAPAGQSDLAYLLFPRGGVAGCGLVINDKLVRGKSGFAGEMSYMDPASKRDDIKKLLASTSVSGKYMEYVAKKLITVTALMNPRVAVLSGDGMTEGLADSILALCAREIPREHIPDLVIKKDYSDDCLAGMIVQALSSLARYPQLLEFSPVVPIQLRKAE